MSKRKILPIMTLLLFISGCSITEYSYTTAPNPSEIQTVFYGGAFPEEIIEISSGATGSYHESGYARNNYWH